MSTINEIVVAGQPTSVSCRCADDDIEVSGVSPPRRDLEASQRPRIERKGNGFNTVRNTRLRSQAAKCIGQAVEVRGRPFRDDIDVEGDPPRALGRCGQPTDDHILDAVIIEGPEQALDT